jgi:hypothetical protein
VLPLSVGAGAEVSSEATRFRVNPLIDLRWDDWGEDSVVLEARSGQLFQFDALSAAVIGLFEAGLELQADVLSELRSDLGTQDAELGATLHVLVQEFRRLGWLEPIIP